MDAAAQAEVWSMLDREALAEIAARGPEVVFATISGAHLYGFASPDSDVDLRGAFLLPSDALLRLDPAPETMTITDDRRFDLDWVAHDLRKFVRMMVNHNGYALEQLFSPLVVVSTPTFEALRAMGRGCVTRPILRHYRGFARGRLARLAEPGATVKHLLYAYRVYLSGIHVLRTGDIVSHLGTLLALDPRPSVEALVARKRAGAEFMALEAGELETHQAALAALEDALLAAHAHSTLPEEPTTRAELEAIVLSARRARPASRRGLRLETDTIFVALAGSQAHGTAGPGSDVDLRGVCVAPPSVKLSLFTPFEQHEGPLGDALWSTLRPRIQAHPTAARGLNEKVESVVFELSKFLGLCATANPNALEILFTDPGDWLLETPAWHLLHAARGAFLTRKIGQTFVGYADAQLRKITSHRAWLLTPPAAPPTRREFGLPDTSTLGREARDRLEEAIAERARRYGLETLEFDQATRIALEERLRAFWLDAGLGEADEARAEVAARGLGLSSELTETLRAERRYQAALRHWDAYRRWKAERNRARAELEARFGYDTKHGMHLVRLMRMGVEAMETGELRVRRPDAEELRAIKAGAWSFEALTEHAQALRAQLGGADARSPLASEVDREVVETLAYAIRTSVWGG